MATFYPALKQDNLVYTPYWSDEFKPVAGQTIEGGLDAASWYHETMDDALNRAGNENIDASGRPAPGNSVRGKRWAFWYNKYRDIVTQITDHGLEMRGYLTDELDLTRKPYKDARTGKTVEFNKHRFYTGYITTARRKQDEQWSWNPESKVLFKPGTYIEIKLNAYRMLVDEHRVSGWWMPYEYQGKNAMGKAYNDNAADGVEIDIFEICSTLKKYIMQKVVGGEIVGDTEGGMVDLSLLDIDLFDGEDHTIGCLWTKEELVWDVDGIETNRDTERVPQGSCFFKLTREGNSGVQAADAQPPYVPADPGLFGGNAYNQKDKLNDDVVYIRYVRAWTVAEKPQEPPCETCGQEWPNGLPRAPSEPVAAAIELIALSRRGSHTLKWPRIKGAHTIKIYRNNTLHQLYTNGAVNRMASTPAGRYKVKILNKSGKLIAESSVVEVK